MSTYAWRLAHFILYIVALCSSIAAILPSVRLQQKFNGKCPLFSDVFVITDTVDNTTYYDFTSKPSAGNYSVWSPTTLCEFCVYTPAASFMYALIWAWFFCICSSDNKPGSAGISKPWRLVPPATFFTILMTIVIFVAAVVMTQGMQHFCKKLEESPVESCWNAEQVQWSGTKNLHGFYGQHLRAVAALWVCTSAWCIATIVLLIRCCCTNVDFATHHGTPMDQLVRRRSSYEHLKQEEQT